MSYSKERKLLLAERIREQCEMYKTIDVLKEVYNETNDIKPKLVVLVDTYDEAIALQELLKQTVETENANLSAYLKAHKGTFTPIKYNIKVIEGRDLKLSSKQAHKTIQIKKASIIERLMAHTPEEPEEIEIRDKDLETAYGLSDDQCYYLHTYTGLSYRLTYYNDNLHERHQVSVGNVCIVVTSDENIVFNETRKQRSDTKADSLLQSLPLFEVK